jgi:hypothetical protein
VRALLDIQLLGHGGIDITSKQGGSAGVVTPSQGESLLLEVGGTELSRQAANRCGLAELQSYVHIPMVMSQ